jgi:hypothetical protein
MTINTYDIGDVAVVQGEFKTHAGVNADPTTVTCVITDPDGTVTTTTSVTKVADGVYTYDVDVTKSGVWKYHFAGTGGIKAAGKNRFYVDKE